jgi:hypothetical protein
MTLNKLITIINAVDAKFNQLPTEKYRKLEKILELDYTEFMSFQELKSLAQIKGILDYETAQYTYNALHCWDKQTLGTRYILTKLHADLIDAKIKGKL